MLRCLLIPASELKPLLTGRPSVMYRMLQVERAASAGCERMGQLDERPFHPATSTSSSSEAGQVGCRSSSLAQAGIERCAVISRDDAPGGMFRRFPVYQRLISWTKPDAPVARGTREYEWYDHNSLVGDVESHQALTPMFMNREFDLPARREMESALAEFAARGAIDVRYRCEWLSTRIDGDGFVIGTSDGTTAAGRASSRWG